MISVVIFAAGRGSRLGVSVPKFVVEVASKPIYFHQLDVLSNLDCQLYIVCGYRAGLLVQLMLEDLDNTSIRRKLTFIYNENYRSGQSGSIARVLETIPLDRPAIFIDGDMLFSWSSIESLLANATSTVMLRHNPTRDGVMANLDGKGQLKGFTRNGPGKLEWGNLALYQPVVLQSFKSILADSDCQHHFELINTAIAKGTTLEHVIGELAEIDEASDLVIAADYVRRVLPHVR